MSNPLVTVAAAGRWSLLATVVMSCGGVPTAPPARVVPEAVAVDVDIQRRTLRVSDPGALGPRLQPSLALLGGSTVRLDLGDFQTVSQAGGGTRVRFTVRISHGLSAAQLTTPTAPLPPAGLDGILMFPLRIEARTLATDGTDGGPGAVTAVVPSDDWNGAGTALGGGPFNLFGTTPCAEVPQQCTRLLVYPSPLLANEWTPARTVGFDVEPGIASFRVWIAVAADVLDLP